MKGKMFQNEHNFMVGSSAKKRSKLESYVDILKVLDYRHPLKLTHVMHRSNLNFVKTKQFLSFLVKQGLVETTRIKGEASVVYLITEKGVRLRKHFRELVELLPIFEDKNQNLGTCPSLHEKELKNE